MAITTKDVWKKLEGVERGAFHIQISWCDVKSTQSAQLVPSLSTLTAAKKEVFVPSSSLTLNRGVLSVCIDSCFNLMGGHFNLSGQLLNHRTYVRGDLGGKVQEYQDVVGYNSTGKGTRCVRGQMVG